MKRWGILVVASSKQVKTEFLKKCMCGIAQKEKSTSGTSERKLPGAKRKSEDGANSISALQIGS